MPEPVNRYLLIHGAEEVGPHPRIEKLPAGTEVVLAADYDRALQEARDIIATILRADERGQGLPFKEAMDRAMVFLARTERT